MTQSENEYRIAIQKQIMRDIMNNNDYFDQIRPYEKIVQWQIYYNIAFR